MSKTERMKLFSNDQGDITQIKIKPEHFSFRALIVIARKQFQDSRERQFIAIYDSSRTVFSAEYIKGVNSLPNEERKKHIVETALHMKTASEVIIQVGASKK